MSLSANRFIECTIVCDRTSAARHAELSLVKASCPSFNRNHIMRPIMIGCFIVACVVFQGCTHFSYTSHQLRVVDSSTNEPVSGAALSVKYAPVSCGGPFAFLGGPSLPETSPRTTDQRGVAMLPLELDWPYGFVMTAQAEGYDTVEYVRQRDEGSLRPDVPSTIALARRRTQPE
jgi:hypothetical protein